MTPLKFNNEVIAAPSNHSRGLSFTQDLLWWPILGNIVMFILVGKIPPQILFDILLERHLIIY